MAQMVAQWGHGDAWRLRCHREVLPLLLSFFLPYIFSRGFLFVERVHKEESDFPFCPKWVIIIM